MLCYALAFILQSALHSDEPIAASIQGNKHHTSMRKNNSQKPQSPRQTFNFNVQVRHIIAKASNAIPYQLIPPANFTIQYTKQLESNYDRK